MLDQEQQKLLDSLIARLGRDQILWVSGYLQGLAGGDIAGQAARQPAPNKPQVDIYYATETGNSKALSLSVMKAVKAAGFKVKSSAVNRIKPQDIQKDNIAIFLVSTHGEGDPPESAHGFFELVSQAPDGILDGLSYAVLGLGDKSYEIFCGAALALEGELSRLGGKAFQDTALFDVDYAAHTAGWIETSVAALNTLAGDAGAAASPAPFQSLSDGPRTGKGYTRLEPVTGVIKDIVNLNDLGSNKETYHIEIAYEEDVIYTPGDAAGIILPAEIAGDDVTPRLYSIASAPSVHEKEVHLTVALASHICCESGNEGNGLCSGYLSRLKAGDEIVFYISQNQIFNLPGDDQDAIMIGPGTGIAPFRSFIMERAERGGAGRNWLFFGDQHAHCDFLYQAEWQEHLAMETLHRLDLAFSRDQDQKVYVQNRLRERSDEVLSWLDGGAALYLCGAKDPMSRDVEAALIDMIAAGKSYSAEQAADYLADLEEQGRYLKDVY